MGKQVEGAAGSPSRARRVSRTGVGGAALRGWHRPRRTVPHSGGDGFPPRELVRQDRGVSPRRMMVPPAVVRALNARTRVRERACVCGAPSSEAELARGRWGPSSEAEPARGIRTPSNGAEPTRGRHVPSSEAEPASRGSSSGPPGWAVRATVAWAMPHVFKRDVFGFGFLQVLSGVSPVV
jgi:hypothetical protein